MSCLFGSVQVERGCSAQSSTSLYEEFNTLKEIITYLFKKNSNQFFIFLYFCKFRSMVPIVYIYVRFTIGKMHIYFEADKIIPKHI